MICVRIIVRQEKKFELILSEASERELKTQGTTDVSDAKRKQHWTRTRKK